MNTEEKKDKKEKAKYTDFASTFSGCQEMFEGMNKCCMGQDGSADCSPMMEKMMKRMMEMCCGLRTNGTKSKDEGRKI
jgi:hypothetical protein